MVLPHPALQRRSALRDRRPLAVRRHTGRVATRFAVLVLGDIVAIFLARAIALFLAAETVDGSIAYAGTPLVQGGTRFIFVGLLILTAGDYTLRILPPLVTSRFERSESGRPAPPCCEEPLTAVGLRSPLIT